MIGVQQHMRLVSVGLSKIFLIEQIYIRILMGIPECGILIQIIQILPSLKCEFFSVMDRLGRIRPDMP